RTRLTLASHAHAPHNELDGLDATLEQRAERALTALVRRELTGRQADIRRHPREALTVEFAQGREHGDPTDLVRRHHRPCPLTVAVAHPRSRNAGAPEAKV